ncbi:MAG: glycosyltransferase family 61 protein [Muribaculaceae bacterium]|nr:glycosyltransferase family 61 protein [Muribaculaceae bacterium]MDE6134463.1 glycosyltransferase family 61 protein [Muribaculaceae bacterium]
MTETQYLRPFKAKCAEAEWEKYEDRSNKLNIRHFSDVTVRAMGQHPGIQAQPGRFIDDCDYYSEIADREASSEVISGKTLYAGFFRKAWGHFLMNSTARLWPLFAGDNVYDKIVFFSENNETQSLHGNFKDFLSLAGIARKCVILPAGTYHFENLTVGEISFESGKYFSAEFMLPFKAVRDSALAGAATSEHRCKGIILARSRWNGNNAVQQNIKSIEAAFTDNGYKAVYPESTPLSDLILKMESADCVVSFSGSTAHNILFADRKKLIILERCAANNLFQTGIAKMLGSECVPVDCFYQPLLVSSTDNLTIYGFTPQFMAFARDYGMETPHSTRSNPEREFRRLLRLFRRTYGYGTGLNHWEIEQSQAVAEAYFESYPRYSRCLERRVPVMWFDWLSPRVYLRMLRDMIKRQPQQDKKAVTAL